MSNYTWLIDAGHGGIDIMGKYVTAPNKMFNHGDFTIYEGLINRQIARRLKNLLKEDGIKYRAMNSPIHDDSLRDRVKLADKIHHEFRNCIYLSIHSNAGGGRGNEIYTSVGQTKSDKVAQIFCEMYKKHFPDMRFRGDRSDGDDDKESQFYVLRKTDCPALLVENGFFDNREEALFLNSEKGQIAYAKCLHESIKTVEKLKLI